MFDLYQVLCQIAQVNRNNPWNTLLNHGDSIDDICAGHCSLVVSNDNKLWLIREFPDDIIEHGEQIELQKECGFDPEGIAKAVISMTEGVFVR